MKLSTVNIDALYRPENVTELAAGDHVWIVDLVGLHRSAADKGMVFNDRDLAVITAHGCRGRIASPGRVPRRHKPAARLIESAATQERLSSVEVSMLTAAADQIDSITSSRAWTLPVLNGRRVDLGATLSVVLDTVVEVGRSRRLLGPPSDESQVAAALTAAQTRMRERLSQAQAHVDALTRYAARLSELDSQIRTIASIDRINHEGKKHGRALRPSMSNRGATVPRLEVVLARLDLELRHLRHGRSHAVDASYSDRQPVSLT